MHRMILRIGLAFTIIFLFVGESVVFQSRDLSIENFNGRGIIYVDDDAESSWYDATHVRTIQEGVNNASSDDTVYVYAGIYYENVIVNKTINLVGEDKNTTIIDCNFSGDAVYISADSVSISRFTIRNSGSFDYDVGVEIYSNYNNISGNNISSNNWGGIYLQSSSNNTIMDNIISNNSVGICLHYSCNNNISRNTINLCGGYGIYLDYSSNNNIIMENNASNNNYAIALHESSGNKILDNDALGNIEGIYLNSYSDGNNISGNNISNNWRGMGIMSVYNNSVFGNVLLNNTYGMWLWWSSNNTLTYNILSDNDVGLLLHGSSNNTIYNNYFSNTDNIYDDLYNEKDIWNITKTLGTNIIGGPYLGGNYWSDYTGNDLDGDGLGDTDLPYNCSGNIVYGGDLHPLVSPNYGPIANFTYSPINPTTQDIIQFTDTSTDFNGTVVSWLWDFGDGNSSIAQNPTHQYGDDGNYAVVLNVTDDDGATDDISKDVIVRNLAPIADFVYSPSNPYTFDVIQFTDASTDVDGTVVSWLWDFGDGNSSIVQNPTHQFRNDGIYTVILNVTDDDGATDEIARDITVNQAEIYVDDDADPDWYDETHVKTIKEGITKAIDGNTIYVYNGTYYENVVINKAVDLIGEDKNSTIIDGGGSGDVIRITVSYVKVCGFYVTNSGSLNLFHAGFETQNADYCRIEDNIIMNNWQGILIRSDNNILQNNNCSLNARMGIYLRPGSNNNLIEKNINSNNAIGILIERGNDNIISNNRATSNTRGIHLIRSEYNMIASNNASDNLGQGIYLQVRNKYNNIRNNTVMSNGRAISLWSSSNNNITNNTVLHSRGNGILLESSSSYNTITDNICSYNRWGVEIIHSNARDNVISYNSISDNTYGINIGAFSSGNIISHNNISDNRYGIRIARFSSGNTITNNICLNNNFGIYFIHSSDNKILKNNINSNIVVGIYILGLSNNNSLYHNNLINNRWNAIDRANNIWDNGYEGNYWSDYTGNDNDGDGIGDTPYIILGKLPARRNRDNYPLINPQVNNPSGTSDKIVISSTNRKPRL